MRLADSQHARNAVLEGADPVAGEFKFRKRFILCSDTNETNADGQMRRTMLLVIASLVSLSIANSLQPVPSQHNTSRDLTSGVARCPLETPNWARQQGDYANTRPAFQAPVVAGDANRGTPFNPESELTALDRSLSLKSSLFRVSFGRAPPLSSIR